jgi:acetyl-CoA synthetase
VQTETGQILLTPLPGVTTTKPGSATHPFPGVQAKILDQKGLVVAHGGGYLVLTSPWPAMTLGIWGDPERYLATYWTRFGSGVYVTGDGAKKDADGYFWVLGRVDDVMNVAGHRIGTMEVESALVDHAAVAEAAVVGVPHELKGTAIVAFVTLREGREPSLALAAEIREHVVRKIGRSRVPRRCCSRRTSPRPAPARSCGGCCVTSRPGRP